MATISERLRDLEFYDEHAMTPDVLLEAADTIDALVAALEVARRSMPLNIGASPHVRAAHSVVDAALARAKG